MASWACARCTFINPPSHKSQCSICSSSRLSQPSSSSSSSSSSLSSLSCPSSLQWSCRACTLFNPRGRSSCEACGALRPFPSPSSSTSAATAAFIDLDLEPEEIAHPAVGSVFLPLQRCGSKRPVPTLKVDDHDKSLTRGTSEWRRAEKSPRVEEIMVLDSELSENVDLSKHRDLKILTYNLWFREDLELHMRMEAVGDIVMEHTPDLICFQEVTPNIYDILQSSNWWKLYKCSVSREEAAVQGYFCMQLSKVPVKSFSCKPFSNSSMGRELCLAEIDLAGGKSLTVATSHLESPCPAPPKWDQMHSKERVVQAKESVSLLKDFPNVVFCGDMNWDDKLDGAFPLADGWIDAWTELRPKENGWTYDTKANQMLSGNRTLQKRLDRFSCYLTDFEISDIKMVGTEAIPGLSYVKEKRARGEVKSLVLPVLPSDHFGLLLTIRRL